jgi:hypothetical protein
MLEVLSKNKIRLRLPSVAISRAVSQQYSRLSLAGSVPQPHFKRGDVAKTTTSSLAETLPPRKIMLDLLPREILSAIIDQVLHLTARGSLYVF